MVRRFVPVAVLFAALAISAYVHAHEGHPHKVMGTVATRHDSHVEIKATDGKTVTITLNEKTKILRGTTKATADDIKPGERVVVTATETKGKDGKTMMIASELRLPEAVTMK